jgi:hypothetical protein
MRRVALLLVLAIAGLATNRAEARPASKGIFTEAGLGATVFIRKRASAGIGPTLTLRAGYDLFSWFSVALHAGASSHEATVPPPPEGEWFQLYRGGGDARLGFRVKSVAAFAEGGIGAAYISSNVLQQVGLTDPGEHFSVMFHAGGGIEYQILNRHYGFGLAGDWQLMPQLDAQTNLELRAYLRYTY